MTKIIFKHIKNSLILLFCIALFSACSSKTTNVSTQKINPLGSIFGKTDDPDPLNLGDFPTLLTSNFTNPMPTRTPSPLKKVDLPVMNSLTHGPMFSSAFSKPDLNFKQPTISLQGIPPDLFDRTSDFMVIMGANGVVITIWYTSPGNWLWGYSLYESGNLGGYRVWRLILLPNNEVMIVNFNTRTTCINTYKNGVIHSPCNKDNPFQKFTFRPMTNGAVQIYNKATNSCLQTSVNNLFGFDVFGAINLTTKCTDTIDQQWYLLPPPQVGRLFY